MISKIRRKNFPADFFEDNREWLNNLFILTQPSETLNKKSA